jgi:hypothetical protein
MSNIRKDHALTPLEVKQLRHCDTLCVDFDQNDTVSRFRAIRKGDATDTGYDQTAFIDIDGSLEVYRGYNQLGYTFEHTTACEVFLGVKYSERVKTLIGLLREGDVIRANWLSYLPSHDGNGSYSTEAQCTLRGYEGQTLYRDELTIDVIRKGDVKYSLLMVATMTPDNSAKLIKLA